MNNIQPPAADSRTISFFKAPVRNVFPGKSLSLKEVYHLIKGEQYRKITGQLRALEDASARRNFKASHFDYVTFSGLFSKRGDQHLTQHSGLLALDFDHVENLNDLKQQLLNDRYFDTRLMFVSPSGDGLKWVISIDVAKYSHAQYFKAVQNYIYATYGIEVDKSGKDISRACFLPYDSQAVFNPQNPVS